MKNLNNNSINLKENKMKTENNQASTSKNNLETNNNFLKVFDNAINVLKMERLDLITKSEAKMLRYCGLDATEICDWKNNFFAIVLVGLTDEDYKTCLHYQESNTISNEIVLINKKIL